MPGHAMQVQLLEPQLKNATTTTTVDQAPSYLKHSIAGTMAGVARVLVGQPFDTIKVRMQAQAKGSFNLYTSSLDCLQKTIQTEGLKTLYKGTTAPLMTVTVCASIQFAVNEQIKGIFRKNQIDKTQPLTYLQFYMAGAGAGFANSLFACPTEHLRTRMQVQRSTGTAEYSGVLDCAKKLYKQHGITSIFKGQGVTTLREIQAYGGSFLTFEFANRQMEKFLGKGRKEFSIPQTMACGAVAGFGMWIPIFPIDTVKSKIQTDAIGNGAKYKSAIDCTIITFQREGIKGFFRGFGPCMLRAAPVNAATFLAFDTTMKLLGRS